jgi:hypothetical protein
MRQGKRRIRTPIPGTEGKAIDEVVEQTVAERLRAQFHLPGVDQTTVGRRISALEARLEAKLFLRSNAALA